MKKHLLLFTSLFLFNVLSAQTPLTFTIINTTGSSSITCAHPSISLLCVTNYTGGFVTYTLAGPGYTAIVGPNPILSLPGNYTITAFSTNVINSTQTLAIGLNTTAPVSSITPTLQTISCTYSTIVSVSATATPSTNVTHQFLSPFGGSLSVSGATASYIPGGIGTYTHVLINDMNGCKSNKSFVVNSSSGIPNFVLSCPQNYTLGCGSNSICNIFMMNAQTSPPGGIITYTLLSALSSTNYVANSQNGYSVTIAGNYTAVVKDAANLCEAKIPFSITQNTSTPNVAIFPGTQTLSCFNAQTTLYGISTTPNVSYTWTNSNGPGSAGTSSITVGTTSNTTNQFIGTYTLTVTENNNACSSSSSIVMYQNIYTPNAATTNTHSSQITCLDPSIVLNNASSTGIPSGSGFPNNLPVNVSQWSGPSPQVPGSGNSYTASTPGNYTLTVIDSNNGCVNSTVTLIMDGRDYPVVNQPVAPPPYCLDPPNTSVDISPIITGPTSNYTYLWVIPGAATVTGQNTPTLTTNGLGVYSILVTNTVSGCTSTGQLTVGLCTGLDQNEVNLSSIQIFPNPSNGLFNLQLNGLKTSLSYAVYDLSGALILKNSSATKEQAIDLQNEKAGLYFIVFKAGDQIQSFKLLKN